MHHNLLANLLDPPEITEEMNEGALPTPEPLEGLEPPVPPPFAPEKLLPEPFGPWAADVAERMNAPVEFTTTAALVAAAGVVGNRVLVAPDPEANPTWFEAPNLWALLVGEPGTKKSPIMELAFAPLHQIEAELHRENQQARDAWQLARYNRKKGEPLEPDDLHPPPERALLVHDITPEKLASLLEDNPFGLVSYQDELLGLVATWERPERAGERQFYLKLWNGLAPHTVKRIGRGSHYLPIGTLSLIGGAQPGPLARYIREAAQGWNHDGLLVRFGLMVQAELPPYRRVVNPPNALGRMYAERLVSLYRLPYERLGGQRVELRPGVERPALAFDPEAQGLYLGWLEATVGKARQPTTPSLLRSLLEKGAGLVPKLALLLHLLEHPLPPPRIGPVATLRAITLANLYRLHAQRIWWAAIQPEVQGAVLLAQRILARTKTKAAFSYERFTTRDVLRAGWKGLTDPRAVEGAIAELAARGWLLRDGGAWVPNPRVWEVRHGH